MFSCGHVSIDIMFQCFLPKVSISMIHKKEHLKFIKYCRDDFIRFDGDYDSWLLNKKDWMVMPSVCYNAKNGMQFMVCKNHDGSISDAYICPPR